MQTSRNPTRAVRIGTITIGDGHPIAVQSMTATKTQDIDATVALVNALATAGADLIRIAVDSQRDAEALVEIRRQTTANLSVDLQENYRLAELVAPHVDKLRYNPGHLYHHEREKPWREKVRFIAGVASDNDCALRVGVNCGSVDPEAVDRYPGERLSEKRDRHPTFRDRIKRNAQSMQVSPPFRIASQDIVSPMLESACAHCEYLDSIEFERYCVSLKDSDPHRVIDINQQFAARRPDVPLHLGVTEAGMPPDGVLKTRIAFEPLIGQGIGDTIRVSLTVPNDRKHEEIEAGRQILADIAAGRVRSGIGGELSSLNIISCPSCSRVENEAFVELAEQVRAMTESVRDQKITIAVMGCRVNGPGETDDADLGLWCGPNHVNLKRGREHLGTFPYDKILARLKQELDALIAANHH